MSGGRLSVVHVLAPARVGGLERVVQALAAGQVRAGARVLVVGVVGTSEADHPFFAPLEASGVPFTRLQLPTRAYLHERTLMRDILIAADADVLHLHGARMDLLHSGVARSLGIAVVSTAHGSSRLGWRSNLLEWFQLHAWRRFEAVIAVSGPLQQMLLAAGVPEYRLRVIPNGWSGSAASHSRDQVRQRLGMAQSDFVIGFVGRLIAAKGPDVFVEALDMLRDLPWKAVIVGDGMVRASCEASLRTRGLSDRVLMTGHVDDATTVIPAFDAFVLSSRTEGTPIVLFEAMAAGVPIVATAVGGVPDVIGAGAGVLVPPETPEAIAAALRGVMGDPQAARAMSEIARGRLTKDFGLDRWIDAHLALYRAVSRRNG